jgi:hypothetical protein
VRDRRKSAFRILNGKPFAPLQTGFSGNQLINERKSRSKRLRERFRREVMAIEMGGKASAEFVREINLRDRVDLPPQEPCSVARAGASGPRRHVGARPGSGQRRGRSGSACGHHDATR